MSKENDILLSKSIPKEKRNNIQITVCSVDCDLHDAGLPEYSYLMSLLSVVAYYSDVFQSRPDIVQRLQEFQNKLK